MKERVIFEIVTPILMLVVGWLINAYRSKQKKEKDILDNVQHIIDLQKGYIDQCEKRISDRDATLERERAELRKLDSKYEHKVKAVKEAYDCEHDISLCPVLIYDKRNYACDTCAYKGAQCKKEEETA